MERNNFKCETKKLYEESLEIDRQIKAEQDWYETEKMVGKAPEDYYDELCAFITPDEWDKWMA